MILLVGKSGTGKSYIAKAFGFRMVISMTTRDKRPGEEDGIHYKFITKEDYENLVADEIVAQTSFDGNIYCATKQCLKGKEAYIMDPYGVSYYMTMYEIDSKVPPPIVVYLTSPWYKRFYRMVKRQGWKSVWKVVQRMRYDRKAFSELQLRFAYNEVRT
jgi:guanylate kinase